MHVVVNHLRLAEPVEDRIVESARVAVRSVVDAGGLSAELVQVDERHLILVLEFESAEDASRIATEVGGPWMREQIVPLLASPTERSVGPVVAQARR